MGVADVDVVEGFVLLVVEVERVEDVLERVLG